jgi:hypothetical protein
MASDEVMNLFFEKVSRLATKYLAVANYENSIDVKITSKQSNVEHAKQRTVIWETKVIVFQQQEHVVQDDSSLTPEIKYEDDEEEEASSLEDQIKTTLNESDVRNYEPLHVETPARERPRRAHQSAHDYS